MLLAIAFMEAAAGASRSIAAMRHTEPSNHQASAADLLKDLLKRTGGTLTPSERGQALMAARWAIAPQFDVEVVEKALAHLETII